MENAIDMPKGALVEVLCAGGKRAVNRVWEDFGVVVMVCSQRQYDALTNGVDAPFPIGFRRRDVTLLPG